MYKKQVTILLLIVTMLFFTACGEISSEDTTSSKEGTSQGEEQIDNLPEYDPSDLWQYDLSGEYFRVGNEYLPDDYYKNDTDVFDYDWWHYSIRDDNNGYWISSDGGKQIHYTIDIDRDAQTVMYIDVDGDVDASFDLKYSEEGQCWYLQESDGKQCYIKK